MTRGRMAVVRITLGCDVRHETAVLLLTLAYVGFETALIPAGEVENPASDAPVALMAALVIVTTTPSRRPTHTMRHSSRRCVTECEESWEPGGWSR